MIRGSAGILTLSLAMVACTSPNPRVATRINGLAELVADVPTASDPLRWKVITSGVNPNNSTMYTLYGNDVAVQYARTNAERNYPDGAILALVTWQRQEDARWFGAEIPARAYSVELLTVRLLVENRSVEAYRIYEGSPLREVTIPKSHAEANASHVLSLRAAVMP